MSDLASLEFTAAGRAVESAQTLVKDNPDGFDAQQAEEYDRLVEAAKFHHERGMSQKELADIAQLGDKDAQVRQDLAGMAASGEAPNLLPEVDERQMLIEMAQGPTKSTDVIKIEQNNWRNYREHIRQGGTAREYVKQVLSFTATAGGNTVPTRVASSFFENLYRVNGIRPHATVLSMDSGEPINPPKALDAAIPFTRNTTAVNTLHTAVSASAQEADPTTSVVQLAPQTFHNYTRVPRELVEDSATDIESMVGRMLGRRIGKLTELAYAQGTGINNEPDGWNRTDVVGATNISGAGNARRITTAASNTIGYADLHNTVYAVDDFGNWNDMAWLMHKGTVGEIFGLTATDGHPIFKYAPYYGGADNMRDGMGLLLGYPVHLATYCGRAATDSDIVAMFGAMSEYYIRDVNSVEIRRWDQATYLTREVDYTAHIRTDAKFINPDNFSWLRALA